MDRSVAAKSVVDLFLETLRVVSIPNAMKRVLQWDDPWLRVRGDTPFAINLRSKRRIVVVAFGKGAVPMYTALRALLPDEWVMEGMISTPESYAASPTTSPTTSPAATLPLKFFAGGHPVPNAQSFDAGECALRLASELTEQDLLVALISGGGSALLESPVSPLVSRELLQQLHATLVSGGSDIVTVNEVRQRFSGVKGGRLAMAAAKGEQLSLIVSDVPPGQLSAVASGPTWWQSNATRRVLGLPESVELPKQAAELWDSLPVRTEPTAAEQSRQHHVCLLQNDEVLSAAESLASQRGWHVTVDRSAHELPVQQAVDEALARLRAIRRDSPDRPAALILGGELSCPVLGAGRGGRNQSFVLLAAERLLRFRHELDRKVVVLSGATDGVDGNSDSAGAWIDELALDRAWTLGLDPMQFFRASNAADFFERLGTTLRCATGNNLRDLRILLAAPDSRN